MIVGPPERDDAGELADDEERAAIALDGAEPGREPSALGRQLLARGPEVLRAMDACPDRSPFLRSAVAQLHAMGAHDVVGEIVDMLGGGDAARELALSRAIDRGEWARAARIRAELVKSGSATGEAAPAADDLAGAWSPIPGDWLAQAPPARRWLMRHPDQDGRPCAPGQGDGVLPLGRVGVLAAAGGAGKTMALVQLAVSVATGRPWLAHMHIGERGRVLLGLAEETPEECHRRIYDVCRALRLEDHERAAVVERVVALPLMGRRPALIDVDAHGATTTTPALAQLRELLARHAGDGWRLIVLDPMSRWLPGSESSNDVATTALTIAESLCSAPGSPTVMIAAHSSKLARRGGTADTRGVTGIVDAARWEAQMVAADGVITLDQTKSNYSRPWAEPLTLTRGEHGVLRVVSPAELAAQAEARADAREDARRRQRQAAHERTLAAVLEAVSAAGPSGVGGADGLAAQLGLGRDAVRAALAAAVDAGAIVRTGATRAIRHIHHDHAEVPS